MAFDLYLAGAEKLHILNYLIENNSLPKLFNQVIERSGINLWVDAIREGKTKSKLFIDSGAYIAYTKGTEIDVDDYINFVNERMDAISLFAPIDKIPGEFRKPKTKEQILEAPELSWNNYLYMRERVTDPDKLLPVFHRREDFKWLNLMLETKFNGKHIPYIAIAPTTDSSTTEKDEWFDRVFEIIKHSSNPNVKTHAFGVTALPLLEKYPITSADSTAWIRSGAFGSILTKWGAIPISGVIEHRKVHLNNKPPIAVQAVEEYIESFGFKLKDLMHDNEEEGITARDRRIMFNAVYLEDWAKNYKYTGNSLYKKSLF